MASTLACSLPHALPIQAAFQREKIGYIQPRCESRNDPPSSFSSSAQLRGLGLAINTKIADGLTRRRSLAVKLMYVGIMLAIAMGLAIARQAQESRPEALHSILERHDQSGVPGKEIVLGTASLPEGAIIGFHTHPGDEVGYVVRGTLVLKTRGEPDRILHPGDSFFNPRGAIHSLQAPDSAGLAVSTWIIDKGEPLATPAP
jgi:quercetin dioxygenase-like cupin family protein